MLQGPVYHADSLCKTMCPELTTPGSQDLKSATFNNLHLELHLELGICPDSLTVEPEQYRHRNKS